MYYFTIVIQNSELKDADTVELNILASGLKLLNWPRKSRNMN